MSTSKAKARRLRPSAATLLLAFLVGCGQTAVEPPPASSTLSGSFSAAVFFCTTADPQCRSSVSSFETGKMRDLFVFVAWSGVQGQQEQALEFILPDSNLYQRRALTFDTAALPKSQGQPVALDVLPVAGTFISQRALYGTWKVRVFLGGQYVTESPFTLTP